MRRKSPNNNGTDGSLSERLINLFAGRQSRRFLGLTGYILLVGFLFTFNIQSTEPFIYFLGWKSALANGLVVVISFIAIASYLSIRKKNLLKDRRLMWFLGAITLFILLAVKGSWLISLYLVPVAFATALFAIFMDFESALAINGFLALAIGVQQGFAGSVGPSVVGFVGGLVGILETRDIKRSSDLTRIGFSVGLVSVILVFGFRFPFLSTPFIVNLDWLSYGWAALNGLGSALFIAAAVPFAERITQKTSPIGLMELLNPSHPLLERLREEAPGTYHHSQNIASLGENAARAIDADPLLTKVGGYYHDIGKMVRPEFFIENQGNDSNPHDELTPSMSKIVLTSHIKQGIEMGKRYGLREDVLSFIPSHHGTSLIRYFYLKALREHREDVEFPEGDFRYEGELPMSKETSIIALADPVEAASHTLEDMGQDVEEMVDEQIDAKVEDGQLDFSPLTLGDVARIKAAFIDTLRAMDQRRVTNYPRDVSESGDGVQHEEA
ncbi:MAG: HDIG domain-containing metalloprotein [Candidatus Bipolaricaulota bacterium]